MNVIRNRYRDVLPSELVVLLGGSKAEESWGGKGRRAIGLREKERMAGNMI